MKKLIPTPGKWSIVKDSTNLKVGDRIRYYDNIFKYGYTDSIICNRDRFVKQIFGKEGASACDETGSTTCNDIFRNNFTKIQVWVPAKETKREKVKTLIIHIHKCSGKYSFEIRFQSSVEAYGYSPYNYRLKKTVIAAAEKFCRELGLTYKLEDKSDE